MEVGWGRRLAHDAQAGDGVVEFEPGGVQRLASETAQGCDQLRGRTPRQRQPATVDAVADQRMTYVREVYPYLMSPAGLESDANVRVGPEASKHAIVGDGRAAGLANRHPHAVDRVSPDRGIHGTTRRHDTAADRLVFALDVACLELPDQSRMRRQRAADHEQSAGILVQPVHDTRARQPLERRIAMEQCVLQRAARVAGTRMHDQTGGLVDDEKMPVLVDDLERNGLGCCFSTGFHERVDNDTLPARQFVARAQGSTVDEHPPPFNPVFETGAGVLRQELGERLIEAATCRLLGHSD